MNDEELLTAYIAERLPELSNRIHNKKVRDMARKTTAFSYYKLYHRLDVLWSHSEFKWLLFIFVVGVVLIRLLL